MTMNEKAAVGVASADDSRRDQASQQDLPEIEYTMTKAVVQVVELYLLHGPERATSTKELQRWAGLSVREHRAQVAREREAGALLLTRGEGGYILPNEGEKGVDELRCFLYAVRLKAASLWRATIPARDALVRQIGEEQEDGEA